jgi:hypothetical protein
VGARCRDRSCRGACAPRAEPGPSPSASPAQAAVNGICGIVPQSVPVSRIVFFSDLSDRCPRIFTVTNGPGARFQHEPNGYSVTLRSTRELGNPLFGPILAQPLPDDVAIEADIDYITGADSSPFGFSCRIVGPPGPNAEGWYFLLAQLDGNAYVYLMADAGASDWTILGQGTSSTIRHGRNHVRAECLGSTLSLYVNGVLAARAQDARFKVNQAVGVYFRNLDRTSEAQWLITNLLVTKP